MPNTQSDVAIYNMALTRIGCTQTISSFNDRSNEAAQARLWYEPCRNEVLTAFPWPWASGYATLALVTAPGVRANNEWTYAYRYPTDALFIVRLTPPPMTPFDQAPQLTSISGSQVYVTSIMPQQRADGNAYAQPFEIGHDSQGRLIYTDTVNAVVKYTAAVTDPTQFSADFASLLAWRIAKDIAMGLARSTERRADAVKMYDAELTIVRANQRNESQNDAAFVDYQAEGVRARQNG
jgi:hypothetical protein